MLLLDFRHLPESITALKDPLNIFSTICRGGRRRAIYSALYDVSKKCNNSRGRHETWSCPLCERRVVNKQRLAKEKHLSNSCTRVRRHISLAGHDPHQSRNNSARADRYVVASEESDDQAVHEPSLPVFVSCSRHGDLHSPS
jgi:hypothetical protein